MLREIIRDVVLEIEEEGLDAPTTWPARRRPRTTTRTTADEVADDAPATEAYRALNIAMHARRWTSSSPAMPTSTSPAA
jgi:hypothetical protein